MNLELVPTKDLLDQVFTRFDDAIFYGRKIKPDDLPNIATHKWQGDTFACQGMATRMIHLCAKYQDETIEQLGDEDA